MAPLEIEQPSDEQRWSCLQRSILFEEPVSRWDKIVSQLSRHIKLPGSKDIARQPLSQQYGLFAQVFGLNCNRSLRNMINVQPAEEASLVDDQYWLINSHGSIRSVSQRSRYLHLLLALEDLQRFTSESFDTWYYSAPEEQFNPPQGILDFKEHLSLSESQLAWLDRAFFACPSFEILQDNGPWSGEPLREFIVSLLQLLPEKLINSTSLLQIQPHLHRLLAQWRPKLPANLEPQTIVLVEGPTEAVLLPKFADLTGIALSSLGILIQACGGAKQIVRRYISLADATNLPIFIVIDSDATIEINAVRQILRTSDCLHVWASGEVEDLLSRSLFLRLLNQYLNHLGAPCFIANTDLSGFERRTQAVNRLWRERGLGDFDKVEFAEFVVDKLGRSDVPAEVETVIGQIHSMASR